MGAEQTAGAFPASSQPVGPGHWLQGSGEAREEWWGGGEAGLDWIYAISPDSLLCECLAQTLHPRVSTSP